MLPHDHIHVTAVILAFPLCTPSASVMLLICSLTDDVHFNHLREMVAAKVLHCKVTIYPFVINAMCGGTPKRCKYPIPHQTFNLFIYLFILV